MGKEGRKKSRTGEELGLNRHDGTRRTIKNQDGWHFGAERFRNCLRRFCD